MIMERFVTPYLVYSGESVVNALRKISGNRSGVVFAVGESGHLEGGMTDGDFRRWIVSQETIDLNCPVRRMMNRNFVSAAESGGPEAIGALFSDKIRIVPVVDEQGHVVAVAKRHGGRIRVGQHAIDEKAPAFLIAEIGNNHNGSLDLARRLIDEAAKAGADCAKFQMRQMSALYRNQGDSDDASEDLGAQYTLDLLRRFSLGNDELFAAFQHSKACGLEPLCTPWDLESVALLEDYGVAAYKIASADLTHHDLLRAVAATGKPVLLSTGMSSEAEILESAELLRRVGAGYVLLHCNSTYPAPFKDINLSYMQRLREIGDCPVGYSGHERDVNVPIAAVSLGAKVIEKHFTLDKTMEGNDHKVSLLPEEFRTMVEGIRQVEQALGSAGTRAVSQGEMMNREILAKSLVAARQIQPGEAITEDMLDIKSPGQGLQPNQRPALLGRTARRAMQPGDFFYASDLTESLPGARNYGFSRPWGIPVRFHDYRELLPLSNFDLLEFHLSYKDLELEFRNFVPESCDLDVVVHAPELFSGDHVLDLCSPDAAYRHRSVVELQRVIDLTRDLAPFFRRAHRPMIVVNVGGFSMDGFLCAAAREDRYNELFTSLLELDQDGVELIPQTMPPFPWHFGGQRFHNLFVDSDSIVSFCLEADMRICFDVSHSKLACNHYDWSMHEFTTAVGHLVAHLHLADAQGVDGEGLQIGEGEIDFAVLDQTLREKAPMASFIPEIWQGHKNGGEGFWVALNQLERWLGRREDASALAG